jgi:hypothetical protein
MVARFFLYIIVHVADFYCTFETISMFFSYIYLRIPSYLGLRGEPFIFSNLYFFAVPSNAFIRICISCWFCSMGHSWSYSLCDRHSICPLRLGVTQNILDKLPDLGRELYWQMAFFLWLCDFLWIHHTATPLIIFLTQPNSHQINQRHHTHIFPFNWRPSSTSNITELSNELWCHIKGN